MNYLLTATVLLFALWPAYYLLLRYSEKYSLNRLLLLLAMVAVCALPFLEMESPAPVVTQSVQGTISYVERSALSALPISVEPNPTEYLATDDSFGREEVQVMTQNVFDPIPGPYLFYGGVCLLAFFLLGLRLVFILRLHLRSRPNGDRSYRLLHPSAKPGQAFTFGHLLYFSIDVPDDGDFDHILAHERVHARQLHTFDILVSEAFLCLFWFHPAAWWLRTKMRANLEYLVDQEVVKRGSDRRSYQLALVRQSQAAQGLALALPFSEPTLKSRIVRLSGMPEYRLVGVAAALGLLLWMGVAMVTLNGTMSELTQPPAGSYLAAYAEKGDPYFEYYHDVLPEALYSLEVYTNRMVTVDEYLQLRAILAKVPNARLYLYKQPFDKAYSLELRHVRAEAARVHGLTVEPSGAILNMIGLESSVFSDFADEYHPVSLQYQAETILLNGETEGMTIFTSERQAQPSLDLGKANKSLAEGKLSVFVNGQRLELLPPGTDWIIGVDGPADGYTVNGYPLDELGAADWPKIVVEGREMPSPEDRIRNLLGEDSFHGVGSSFFSTTVDAGTFRGAFEDIDWPPGQSMIAYYNDRRVSLDFLLDTEFGPEAFLNTGVVYDTHMGRYAVQVIDDAPFENEPPKTESVPIESLVDFQNIYEVDLYFKRLPDPREVQVARMYLEAFSGYDLRVFQDCQYAPGSYTLYLGDTMGSTKGFSNLKVGDSFDEPLRFNIQRNLAGETKVKVLKPSPIAEGPSESDVYMVVDGGFVSFSYSDIVPYTQSTLDSPPAEVSLKCKTDMTPSIFNRGFWMYTYQSTGPEMMEDLFQARNEENLQLRPMTFYIGERPVEIGEFGNYRGEEGSYAQMGTWTGDEDAPLVLQIIE